MQLENIANAVVLALTGVVIGGTGVAASARNCAVVRTGAGTYTITLPADSGIQAGSTALMVDLTMGTDVRYGRAALSAANVITVIIDDVAGAPADGDFLCRISRIL